MIFSEGIRIRARTVGIGHDLIRRPIWQTRPKLCGRLRNRRRDLNSTSYKPTTTYDKRSSGGPEIAICLNLLGRPRNPLQISATKQEGGSLRVSAANPFLQSRGDRTRLELFNRAVAEMQAFEPLTCQRIKSFMG